MNKLVPTRKLFHIHSADIPSEKNRAGTKPLNVVKYNHNGSYFMSAGNDKRINLWNASSGTHIKSYDAHGYEVTDLCISKDNAKFASVGGDKPVFYWDVAAAVTIRRFAGHFQRVNAVAMSDDGAVIVSVRLWDTKSNSQVPIQVLDDAKDSITAIWVQDHEIVTGSVDGRVRTYDLRFGRLYTEVIGHPITSIQQSKDAQTMLISSLDSIIRLLDKANGGLLSDYRGHTNETYRMPSTFGHTQKVIVSGSEDGRIIAWDVAKAGKLVEIPAAHGSRVVSGLSFHPKAAHMLSCGQDGDIVAWTA